MTLGIVTAHSMLTLANFGARGLSLKLVFPVELCNLISHLL
jgi:hypothetical protein